MGWSYDETLRYAPHVAHQHPDAPGQPKVPAEKVRIPTTNDKGQNKTEAAWDSKLNEMKADGRIRDYWFEPVKLRLGGNTSYKVDFLVQRLDGSMVAIEIKGHMRDDAAVKLKVAPEKFPWLDFCLVRRDGRGWDVRPVTYTGIGRVNIGMDWEFAR